MFSRLFKTPKSSLQLFRKNQAAMLPNDAESPQVLPETFSSLPIIRKVGLVRLGAGSSNISSNVHGRRRTARHQRTETTPAPHVHASQGEGDTVFAHAHRRVHETNFRNCGAVGLQSRLGADNPRGVPQMAGRESRERPASGAARDYRLKRFELKTENRSRNNGSGQRFIASNGDSRHPTAEFRFMEAAAPVPAP